MSNSADVSVTYTLEVRTESSELLFSDTTTIAAGGVNYYADVLGSESYVATVTFDDGTSYQHGWERSEGTVLDVTLPGRDAVFYSADTF